MCSWFPSLWGKQIMDSIIRTNQAKMEGETVPRQILRPVERDPEQISLLVRVYETKSFFLSGQFVKAGDATAPRNTFFISPANLSAASRTRLNFHLWVLSRLWEGVLFSCLDGYILLLLFHSFRFGPRTKSELQLFVTNKISRQTPGQEDRHFCASCSYFCIYSPTFWPGFNPTRSYVQQK